MNCSKEIEDLCARAFRYDGDSICTWESQLDQLEQQVYAGDRFRFSINDLQYSQPLLKRLRLICLGQFEASEGATDSFRNEVVVPLLDSDERVLFERESTVNDFLERGIGLSPSEIEAAESGLISLKWLIEKQNGMQLNALIHQAFDFVQLFYDIYVLGGSEDQLRLNPDVPDQVAMARYTQEHNDWLKFAMGYVVVELVRGQSSEAVRAAEPIDLILKENARLLARWTGRVREAF